MVERRQLVQREHREAELPDEHRVQQADDGGRRRGRQSEHRRRGLQNGGWTVVGGTSASSPFVAGVYALYGLGNTAPGWAYSNASKFFDVTTGKNGNCGTILCNAGAGWDGPTGIGTPNGAQLGGGGTCTPACNGKTCGDDGCGGSCGTCDTGETCSAGICMGGGGGGGNTCAHPICSTGSELDGSCDSLRGAGVRGG